jgi:hypothetical protein
MLLGLRFRGPSSGSPWESALDLLVLGIGLANDAQFALAADNLASTTQLLDAGANLHEAPLLK